MEIEDRRKDLRCDFQTTTIFGHLNRALAHSGRILNYSRSGLYFESDTPQKVGTILVVRLAPCSSPESAPSEMPEHCTLTDPHEGRCDGLKTTMMGEVRRCETVGNGRSPRFGIGLSLLTPGP